MASCRYGMWKVGPVLCVNHGMGQPSCSILVHEVSKLLGHAGLAPKEITIIRVGTSGGLGLKAGTVVVSDQVYNSLLEPTYNIAVCGKLEKRTTKLDDALARELIATAPEDVDVVQGHTMAADTFYESQGRLDGAICEYTQEIGRAHV